MVKRILNYSNMVIFKKTRYHINIIKIEIIVLVSMLITLLFTLVYGIRNKYRYDRPLAYFLVSIYIVVFIGITIIAVIQAFDK